MTAPLFGTPSPWDLARAIWPGAFLEPWQDEQIEQGRGDWPRVATCWRPPRAWRVWLRPLVLHPLPTLRWRYADEAPDAHEPRGPTTLTAQGTRRRWVDSTRKQAKGLGYRYFSSVFRAHALGVEVPELYDVIDGRRYRPSIEALSKLVAEGAVVAPPPQSRGGQALAKHGRREDRIAQRYPDGLPLFGGAP